MLIKNENYLKKIIFVKIVTINAVIIVIFNKHKMSAKHKRLINANNSDEKNETALC